MDDVGKLQAICWWRGVCAEMAFGNDGVHTGSIEKTFPPEFQKSFKIEISFMNS